MQKKLIIYGFITVVLCIISKNNFLQEVGAGQMNITNTNDFDKSMENPLSITLFMCGDVMIGRGIDQVLPYPSDPVIYESYLKSAKGYVELAERVHGSLPYPASFSYIWGDALEVLNRVSPDLR